VGWTISGFARVDTPPRSAKWEIPAITPRMIVLDRVLGITASTQTCLGRAILSFVFKESVI